MPMVRYRVRNEYGLADPELYQSAERDDPEALLEGVAMAGLVGVLRQLGDLAEFAAEIFHDLHEEVMASAARGHGLMLRVQQLEAEFPSIEKAFLSQTSHSRFSSNIGVDWHANPQMDQNLITRGDMPRFILDSYEECRGAPRLFMLDKFDVAGAGACLKRYSDPSFFKINLASSGLMEGDIQREKKARKIKKKGSRWRNGETLESLLAPHIDSNSQPETSDQVSDKIQTRCVKLKSRRLNVPDTGKSYMEKIFEVPSAEQEILLENFVDRPHTKMKSVDSIESVPEVHEIVVDRSAKSPLFVMRSPSAKQEKTGLSTNESKKHEREVAELSETLPDLVVETPKSYSTLPTVKLEDMSNKGENIRSPNVSRSGEVEESPIALQEVDQMELLTDDDGRRGGSDDYRSDDVASDLENFMDALNTMESEVETDNESRVKSDSGFINADSQGMDSDTNEGQLEFQAQISEPVTFENSTKLVGLNNVFKEALTSVSDSDTLSSLAVPATPQGDMAAFSLQANSEVCVSERNEKISEEILNDCKDKEIKSLEVNIVETDSRTSENLWEDGETPQGNMTAYGLQVNSEVCLSQINDRTSEKLLNDGKEKQIKSSEVGIGETNGRTSEKLCEDGGELDLKSSDFFLCNGTSKSKESDILFLRSETGDLSSRSYATDLASSLIDLCPEESFDENHEHQAINATTNENLSSYLGGTHDVADHSYGDQCTADMSEPPSLANDEMWLPSVDENDEKKSVEYAEQRASEDVTGTPDTSGHFLQTKDTNFLEVPTWCLEGLPLPSSVPEGEGEEPIKHDTGASSSGCMSPIITASGANCSSIVVQSDHLALEMENVAVPIEDLAKLESAASLESSDNFVESEISASKVLSLESEHYSDAEELQEHYNVDSTNLALLSAERESSPSGMLLQYNAPDIAITDGSISIGDNLEPSHESAAVDPLKDEVQIGLTESDSFVTEKVTIETKADEHDPCSFYSPEEEPGSHIHSQNDFVPHGTALNLQNLETDEIPGLKDIIALNCESTQNVSLSSRKEDQLVSAPTISCFEPLVQDSLPSEHALENFQLDTDKDSQVLSLESEQDFNSKTPLQCFHENAQEDISSSIRLTEPAVSFEEASETRASNELELNSLQEDEVDYEHLVPSDHRESEPQPIGQTGVLNASLDLVHRESEQSREFVSSGKTSEVDTPPFSQLEPEIPFSLEITSEASVNSLASNMDMAPLSFLDFGLARSETNPRQLSEPLLDEPVSSSPTQHFRDAPPLPPLPPLQWRMGKLQLGSQVSDGNSMQPPIGSSPFMMPLTTSTEHPHSYINLGDELGQPADLSATIPALEENPEPSFVAERKVVQPLRFSELPSIIEDTRCQNGIEVPEGEMMHPVHSPSVAPPIEDAQHPYSRDAFEGCMVCPSNPFAQLPTSEDEMSQHIPARLHEQCMQLQISDNERPLLGQVQPNLESNRPQHGAPSLEKDYVQPIGQYWAVSTAEYAIHQHNYGVNGGENIQYGNILVPLPTTGPMIPPHGSSPFMGKNPFAPYDIIEPAIEDEKPNRKRSSILNRPRDPLIEAVASHDKSTLRKVSEMIKPPTRPEEDERDTLLEQIRNKSFNLKPTVVTRPNIKGPLTNLKVAAILEKASAIRQACVGSDEDDDGDSWSDS